jgi:hypothetical protein
MPTITKAFDCVEMQNRIQAQLLAEYEARKDEFPSFAEFLIRSNERDEWVRKARSRLGHGNP